MKNLFEKFLRRQKEIVSPDSLPIEGNMPEFGGVQDWINSPPLSRNELAGKVVLVDFWTYSCINCLRTIPYLKVWHETYKNDGLVIIGVHTPEFNFEKNAENVKRAVQSFGIEYPVVLDNDYSMWNAYRTHYWPSHYFIDGRGKIRYHHFGEGEYGHSEAIIRALLEEAGASSQKTAVSQSIAATVDFAKIGTPETYLGFDKMEYLGSPESVRHDSPQRYSSVINPAFNIFYFEGAWEVRSECAIPVEIGAKIVYRVRASRINLVMDGVGKEIRALVTLDGAALNDKNRGADVKIIEGESIVAVSEGRMYNLVDTKGDYKERLVEITFLKPGAEVFVFTFG